MPQAPSALMFCSMAIGIIHHHHPFTFSNALAAPLVRFIRNIASPRTLLLLNNNTLTSNQIPIQSLPTLAALTGTHLPRKPSPRLFALIIGINEYESPDIPNLEGAVPDADAVRDYLQEHLGVPRSQIRNLRDHEATRTAILEEIKAFSFNNELKEGDPILIYYAGHGGSADTPKGWEDGSTGKIELLIPFDHSSPLEDGNPKHGIPDRTVGALLSHLASKKGDNITVILDCCHSGSGTRNLPDPTLKTRGIDVGNVPSNIDQDIWSALESLKRGSEVDSGFARKGLRSHVLLAACASQELAYERTSRGVFTVALLNTLADNRIDELTYASLFDRMPSLSSGQNPQCEGVFRERPIFNGKASDRRTACYKICESEGGTYVMPDAGEAAGITVGAEFEVHRDQNSGHSLGTVIVREVSAFSTTLYAKGSRFALERDGVAFKFYARTDQLRIHVAENLKDLVKKIDPEQRIIQLVERDQAEFGMALEDGKVVFNIYDSEVKKRGLTRMPHTLEPTLEAISPVIHAAAHFYWHLRRIPQTGRGLAKKVEVEVTELNHESVEYDDEFNPVVGSNCVWKGGKDFDLQTDTTYAWRIMNKWGVTLSLYPALFYFDNSDWSITPYYEPPIARGTVEPPLKGKGCLIVGYGDAGWVPHKFFLREGQNVDVGILKLFLSREQVNLSHVAQSSPFVSSHGAAQSRGSTPSKLTSPCQWDTVEFPVVQRCAK